MEGSAPPSNGSRTKAILAWALYDWGNSAFATTVMAGFFPVVFKEFFSAGVDPATSTARLGLANSTASLAVALAAPFLGALADMSSSKKHFLAAFALVGIASTLGLTMVGRHMWLLACVLYGLALAGFLGGNVFYDSLLKTVSTPDDADRVSTLGYALGYLGGGILFAFNLWVLDDPSRLGMADALSAARFSFVTVGLWWAAFAIPLFVFVREAHRSGPPLLRALSGGIARLGKTLGEARHMRPVVLFLLAYWLYIDGVDTIIVMAVDYGLSLGFDMRDLVGALLLVQFVGFPCALGFGRLASLIGAKRSILIAILVYLCVIVWAAFIEDKAEFFIMAVLIGSVQGGVQALSRSFFSRLIPTHKAAEFFGIYNMVGKFAAIVGPLAVGITAVAARALGASARTAPRFGIVSVAVLFVAGGALLSLVDDGAREDGQGSERR